jgi:hypothetical protein
MQRFMTGFRLQHGSFEAYAEALGVGEEVAVLRHNLLTT